MFKLDLEKAEKSEIKMPTFVGSTKKAREFHKHIYFCFIEYAKAFDCVDHNKLWKILKEMGIPEHLTLTPVKPVCRSRNNRTGHGTTGSKLGKAIYYHPAYLTSIQSTSCEMPGLMKHSWNQDCREKYQSPQICR